MSHRILFRLSRSSLFASSLPSLRPTMATATFSFKLARKSLKSPPDPGRYSTYASMTRPLLAGRIPHPSTHAVRPNEEPQTFQQPSRPRPMYERPQFKTRELPVIKVSFALGRGLSMRSILRNSLGVDAVASLHRSWGDSGLRMGSLHLLHEQPRTARHLCHPPIRPQAQAVAESGAPRRFGGTYQPRALLVDVQSALYKRTG